MFLAETKLLNEDFLESLRKYNEDFPGGDLSTHFQSYIAKIDAIRKVHPGQRLTMPSITETQFPTLKVVEDELKALTTRNSKQKSKHYISWHEYFMSVAQLAARRSKDPSTQVGACIVNVQNKIVATGYNGMPNRVSDDLVPWEKEGPFLETKYAYVVHAELNAILNCILTDQTGCRLYVSLFPCNECAKAIIQSGIRHVIFLSDKHKAKESTEAAKKMFQMAGISYEQYSALTDK